jgi:hypothetical protein
MHFQQENMSCNMTWCNNGKTAKDFRFKWQNKWREHWCITTIDYNNVRSLGDYRNYVGGNATTNDKARSHVYPTISTKFGKLTMF